MAFHARIHLGMAALRDDCRPRRDRIAGATSSLGELHIWWFGTWLWIFPAGKNIPNWINWRTHNFQRGRYTTNHIYIYTYIYIQHSPVQTKIMILVKSNSKSEERLRLLCVFTQYISLRLLSISTQLEHVYMRYMSNLIFTECEECIFQQIFQQ